MLKFQVTQVLPFTVLFLNIYLQTKGSLFQSVSKLTDLPMPIEDSQDLLGSPLQCSQAESTPRNKTLGSFSFNLDESTTCSHMLDEEG